MENVVVNRAYLESLSFADLMALADENGIDVPEDLTRSFLIGELLEVYSEEMDIKEDDMILSDDEPYEQKMDLFPRACNLTEVQIMLRDPAWAYIYWNISESDRIALDKAFISKMMIRVNSFSEAYQVKPDEFFDINISKEDNGQYVLLPAGKKYFRVDLLFNLDGIIDILSSSKVFEMPRGFAYLADLRPGRNEGFSKIMELSGINELLKEQYENHRESFS
ncbi:MAG: DUF4912 domain-containing protein [Treponema sp.]|nr:DUF4912 domain-containing protein [Treponema sp.]